jgi:membrane-associated protein
VFDLPALIQTVGYVGLFIIVFAETGLLIGFFLPGDSLLITAGLLAAQGLLSLPLVMVICTVAAILGNLLGYWIGLKVGPMVFQRDKSRFFKPSHVEKTRQYFEKYGPNTIILARYIPIVRTFVSTFAGVAGMPFGRFALYSVIGGILWGVGLPLIAYYLGRLIPELDKYILLVIGLVVFVSVIPIILEYFKHKRASTQTSTSED